MTKIYLNQSISLINEYSNETVHTAHYIVETNRLSLMLDGSLNFILQQLSLYFFRKNIRYWFSQDYYHATTSLHFLVGDTDEITGIQSVHAYDFKSYIENILGEPSILMIGGVCYV